MCIFLMPTAAYVHCLGPRGYGLGARGCRDAPRRRAWVYLKLRKKVADKIDTQLALLEEESVGDTAARHVSVGA